MNLLSHLTGRGLSRRTLYIIAIIFSLLGVLGLAGISAESESYWSAKHAIATGSKITESDVVKVNGHFAGAEGIYLKSTQSFKPRVAVRGISKGEILPISAIAETTEVRNRREVTIGIQSSDLPPDLTAGNVIDIYLVPRDTHVQSEKIVASAQVVTVDERSRNVGGVINVVISLKEADILYLTDAVGLGRLLAVRHAL